MKDKTGWNKYRRKPRDEEQLSGEIDLLVDQLTNAGDGLGRSGNRVVFVPYTMPGDRVRVRITQTKKSHALGTVVQLLEPSESRIDAPCPWFGRCGGCDWQHIPYALQLEAKSRQLAETLRRVGKLDQFDIEPIIASPKPYGYRNRIQGFVKHGRFHYKWRHSDQLIAIDRCALAEAPINEFLQSDLSKGVQGRVEIASEGDRTSVLPVNQQNSTELGFRQVNSAVSELLTEQLLETIGNYPCSNIIDLYCGRGHWTNLIARRHPEKRLMGVDASADNIVKAREQATLLQVDNVVFHHATVEKSLKKLPIQDSLCIVDPPRAGLDSRVIDALIATPCRQLIYVSCHPATLARDLQRLTASTYRIGMIVPMDMFPQTAHLETFVQLTVNEAP